MARPCLVDVCGSPHMCVASPLLDRPGHRGAPPAGLLLLRIDFSSGAPAQIWGRFAKMGASMPSFCKTMVTVRADDYSPPEMQITCVRVARRLLEKLMMWNRAYETTISDGYRQTIARGPNPWTSEKEAQRLWAASQQEHADRSHAHH